MFIVRADSPAIATRLMIWGGLVRSRKREGGTDVPCDEIGRDQAGDPGSDALATAAFLFFSR